MSAGAWSIRNLPAGEIVERADEVAGIYQRAFGYTAAQRDQFRSRLVVNVPRYGGTLLLAAEDGAGRMLGFLYGYDLVRGNWWPQQIAPALEAAGHGRWLEDAFELAEIEVDPAAQRRGIGSALLRAMLDATSHRRALLSTTADPVDRAKVLYRRHGFVELLPRFRYGGSGNPAVIMGRERDRLP